MHFESLNLNFAFNSFTSDIENNLLWFPFGEDSKHVRLAPGRASPSSDDALLFASLWAEFCLFALISSDPDGDWMLRRIILLSFKSIDFLQMGGFSRSLGIEWRSTERGKPSDDRLPNGGGFSRSHDAIFIPVDDRCKELLHKTMTEINQRQNLWLYRFL